MASPLDTIERGIKLGDWARVVLGFQKLSGKKLKVPAGKTTSVRSVDDIPEKLKKQLVESYVNAIQAAVTELTSALDGDIDDDDDDPESGQVDDEDDDDIPPPREEDEEEEEDDDIPEQDPTVEETATPIVPEGEEEPNPFDERDDGKAPPPAAGTVEARASEARAFARGEKALPDFTHVHTGVQQQDEHPELGRRCRTEPFKPGAFKNKFKDNLKNFRDQIPTDRKLNRGRRPAKRRPPVKKVKVKCFKCEKDFVVDPALVPKSIAYKGGTESTNYVCDGCMKRSV